MNEPEAKNARDAWRRAQIAAILAADHLGVGARALRIELAEAVLGFPVQSWNDLSTEQLRALRLVYVGYPYLIHQRREVKSRPCFV